MLDRVETFLETKREKWSNPGGAGGRRWSNESTLTSKPEAVVVVAVEKQDTCSVIAVAVRVVLLLRLL